MTDFSHLVTEVMVRRMGGPTLTADYQDALASWLHAQPAPKRSGLDEQAIARGRELFESPEVACASCHTGPLLSNHATVDVGTGLATQVPSLLGVSFRAPYMHDGCAASLLDRFGESCGGGDQHGKTSHLSQAQLTDLAEYLESL
jgi:mono/diheme cytochrome c family protein